VPINSERFQMKLIDFAVGGFAFSNVHGRFSQIMRLAAAVFALGALTASVRAAPRLRVYVLDTFTRSTEQSGTSGPLTAVRGGSGEDGSAAARAFADFGVLKVFAEAHAANTGNRFGLLNDGAQASFEDVLTIDSPGKTGSRGTLTVRVNIDGSITCQAGGWDGSRESTASAEFRLTADGWTIREGSYWISFTGETGGENFLGKEQVGEIGFTFGTPFTIKLYVETVASAYNYAGADAVGDLENTATWGGFVSVKDSSGVELADYTASSESGANYVTAILASAPRLTIGRLKADAVEISWSTNFGAYTVQTTESLSPANWTAVTNEVITNGANLNLSMPIAGEHRYFRLHKEEE
jgi:hypothetical protein